MSQGKGEAILPATARVAERHVPMVRGERPLTHPARRASVEGFGVEERGDPGAKLPEDFGAICLEIILLHAAEILRG